MDGKHVLIRPPPNSGSYYYNYKHSFGIVLLAVVDLCMSMSGAMGCQMEECLETAICLLLLKVTP